jgi:hypothetical protein
LELSLAEADRERRKRARYRRALRVLPLLLLVGPILGWHLTMTTPNGVHVGIAALAWVTFMLDVGVHADTAVLSYLGLSQLPTIVGVLLLVVVTGWLLSYPRGRE